jgi:hypothetical protein
MAARVEEGELKKHMLALPLNLCYVMQLTNRPCHWVEPMGIHGTPRTQTTFSAPMPAFSFFCTASSRAVMNRETGRAETDTAFGLHLARPALSALKKSFTFKAPTQS